jgi:hypothetical protein
MSVSSSVAPSLMLARVLYEYNAFNVAYMVLDYALHLVADTPNVADRSIVDEIYILFKKTILRVHDTNKDGEVYHIIDINHRNKRMTEILEKGYLD